MFLAPAKAPLNVSEITTVRVLLAPETDEPAPFILHWLFSTVLLDPTGTGDSGLVNASLAR